jgi:putative transposase
LKQLDKAYSNFFRRLKNGEAAGFPRFKSETSFKSICFPQPKSDLTGGCIKKISDNKLKVSGIPGDIKIKWHRDIPSEAIAKQVRIVRSAGKYYVMISCDGVPEERLAPTGKTVGIDLGLNNFITLDDGTVLHHPRPYKTSKEKLAFLNKKLALKKRGSNNRKRTLVALQRASEHIRNIREDFQHKASKMLVAEYDTIVIEKLNVKNLMEKKVNPGATPKEKAEARSHNNNIQDASWGGFAAKLIYKAESAGRKVIEVDPRYTSMTCSSCLHIQNMPQEVRIYNCGACSAAIDRDWNAALNIRRLGINLAATEVASEAPKL